MYRCTTWSRAKRKHQAYHRREPERSALYRVVSTYRELLPRVWAERYQAQYGVLRDEVLSALDEYLNCGLLCHGAARVYCDSCQHSFLVAFSCKKRGVCPSCNAKRAVIFAEHLFNDVLAQVPHRHVVFTIPKRLRSFGRYDRDTLGHLFSAASGAVAEVRSGPHGIPGLVLTAQTAGDALNWNPHLHGLLADGLFNPDGSFAPFKLLDEAALLRRFSELCVANFLNQELITESVAAQILSQEHSGFSVWLGEPFKDEESAKFVARYIERGPLALERLSATENTVLYTTKTGEIHRYDPLDFLALLTAQIPKPYESICRYYGWYSCRSRGERKKAATVEPVVSQLPEEPLPATPSSRWAACIKRVYEIDPLECPKCKATMRVISFITDPHALAKIMKSLGVPQPKNPAPMAQSPPAEQELFDDGPQYW